MLSQIIACDIQPLQNTSTMRYLKETLKLDDAAVAAWLREWITRGLDAFNAHLEHDHLSRQVLHGDTPTMADCCLVPQMFAAERFGVDPDALSAPRADLGELQSHAGVRRGASRPGRPMPS